MSKYASLDKMILDRIQRGPATFVQIDSGAVGRYADELAPRDKVGALNGWRLLDRRLQALRKAGVVRFKLKTGWELAQTSIMAAATLDCIQEATGLPMEKMRRALPAATRPDCCGQPHRSRGRPAAPR